MMEKIKYVTVILILFLVPGFDFYKTTLTIGGIFHDNFDTETIFTDAITNNENQNVILEPKVQIVPSLVDSFKAGKVACTMAAEGVSAIVGPESGSSSNIVESVCSTLEIPHIQTHWDPVPSYPPNSTVINLYPEVGLLSQAIADLITDMDWKTFTVVYENDEGLIRLQETLKLHGPTDLPIIVRQLDPGPDNRPLLKEIVKSHESFIVLDCEPDRILEIIRQAAEVGLAGDYNSFILTSLDAHTIDFAEFKYSKSNFTTLRLFTPDVIDSWEMDFPKDMKTETALIYDAVKLFSEALADEQFKVHRFDIGPLYCNGRSRSEYGQKIIEVMKKKSIDGLTGTVQINENGIRTDFTLEAIQLFSSGFKKRATWDSSRKPLDRFIYTRTAEEMEKEMELNIQSKVFIVTARLGMPFLQEKIAQENEVLEGNDRFEGYAVDLIDAIAKYLKFEYIFKLVDDTEYGSYNKDTNRWTGLIGELLEKKADLAICDLTITSARRKAVDFTKPFMTLGIGILYLKPGGVETDLFSFMAPLSTEVWLYIALSFVGVTFVYFIIARMCPSDWENSHPCDQDPEELENCWEIKNCVWLSLGSLMGQGCDLLPKGIASRMATGMWWFFALIILASYTANLAAFLTNERSEDEINSAEDLSQQSKVKYGALATGSTLQFFKNSNFSVYQRMWSSMESERPSVLVKDNPEGINRVLSGRRKYAYLMESTSIEYAMSKHCELTQIGDNLDSKGYGIAMPFRGIFYGNVDTENIFAYAINTCISANPNFEITDRIYKISSPTDSFQAGKAACTMAAEGVSAIVGPGSGSCSSIVESVCSTLEIPHIQTHWDPVPSYSPNSTIINLYPEVGLLSQAIADLITDMDWRTFTVIYENDEGLIRLQETLKLHGPKQIPITVRQLDPGPDNRLLLKEVLKNHETHIVLDCEADRILEILSQADEVGLNGEYTNYILTSLDAHTVDFTDFKNSSSNFTSLRLLNSDSDLLQRIEQNWNFQPLTAEKALTYDAVKLFSDTLADVDLKKRLPNLSCTGKNKLPYGSSIVKAIKMKSFEGLTGNIQINENGSRTQFTLEAVQLLKGVFTKRGTWDSSKESKKRISYIKSLDELEKEIELNIQNKVFVVSAKLGMPYLQMKPVPEDEVLTGNDRFEGYSVDIIDAIAKHLNFKYEFKLVEDQQYGSYQKDTKRWNGLIGDLLEKRADLAICDLTITSARRQAVDFTKPFMTLGIGILYVKPGADEADLFSFMAPLSTEVWLYMALAFVGVTFCYLLIARMSPTDWENPQPADPDPTELENCWEIKNCIWLSLGSLMAQGCDLLPKGIASRMAAGMWWFFALIILSSYTANLAAFLTNEQMEDELNTVEDLAKQSKVKYGAVASGSTLQFFKNSNFSIYQRMWGAMESESPSVFVEDNPEGINRVLSGRRKYAFLMESTSIEYAMSKHCQLMQIGDTLDSKGYGIAMPFQSPFRTAISGAVLKLQEGGTLHKLKTKWWVTKVNSTCKKEKAKTSSPELDMANVGGVFLVLVLGCCIAAFIGVLEFLWNVRKIAVDNKLTSYEAFMLELKFAMNIFLTKKPVNPKPSENSSRRISSISFRGVSETRNVGIGIERI